MMRGLLIVCVLVSLAQDCMGRECDAPEVINMIRPGAQWALTGNTYESLQWLDATQAKPTKSELLNAYQACKDALEAREDAKRIARFTVKLSTATALQKVNAVILLLSLDK